MKKILALLGVLPSLALAGVHVQNGDTSAALGSVNIFPSSMTIRNSGNDNKPLLRLDTTDTVNNPGAIIIFSSGTGVPLSINSQGIGDGAVQDEFGGAVNIRQTVFGDGLVIVSSYTDAQGGSSDLLILDRNVARNDPIIRVFKAAFNSAPEMRWDSPAPNMEMVATSSDNAHGRGKWEPFATGFASEILQVNSRSWDNSTFENVAYWEPLSIQPSVASPGLYLRAQDLTNDSGILTSSSTAGVNFFTLNGHTVGIRGPANVASGSWLFTLPSTFANAGQVLYQTTSSTPFSWEFTTAGTTGNSLRYNSGSPPTWGTPQLTSQTKTQIAAITPSAVGQMYYCSDCATLANCVSTGTVVGSFSSPINTGTPCQ